MTTKLEAVNLMLSCIGASPVNTLSGLKSAYTVAAETLLDSETKRVQITGYDFNTEYHYKLTPDVDNIVTVPDDIVSIKIPHPYSSRYIIRDSKLYDRYKHTFTIEKELKATVIFTLNFDELPEVFRNYIAISSAYKFVKRELGSNSACIYTKEDVQEAYTQILNYDIETGNYSFIKEMHNGEIRNRL